VDQNKQGVDLWQWGLQVKKLQKKKELQLEVQKFNFKLRDNDLQAFFFPQRTPCSLCLLKQP
jgi:hypothetical protein